MYSQLQPWIRPELVNLLEQRIDDLSTFLVTVGDKQEEQERWCQGVVKSVLKDSRQPFVIVNWDGMPDVKGWEDIRENYCQVCTTRTRRERGGWMLMLNFVRLVTQAIITVMVMTMKVTVMKM